VLSFRDVTKIQHVAKLSAENKVLTIYNSTMSHELLTPLRCIKLVAASAKSKTECKEILTDLNLVINATDLLLN
jgi:signal transduction histidine kinase